MVPIVSMVAMVITLGICTVVPLLALIVYAIKNKGKGVWIAWLLGAAGFFVMQIVIRTSILSLVQMMPGFMQFVADYYIVYVAILAFTAALFEVVARYVVAKILKKKQCYEVAVGAGLGHGGIEALVLIGLTYVNNILYSIMINTGAFDTMVSQTAKMGVDVSQLMMAKKLLITTHPMMYFLAGYERILTMVIHIALTVLVFYFVSKKKDFVGIILCLLIHTLVDFVPGFIQGLDSYIYIGIKIPETAVYLIIYAFLTIMAIVGIIITVSIRKKWKKASE